MFNIFKKAADVAEKAKKGIEIGQRFIKAFEVLKDDLDGDGKPEYKNLEDSLNELKALLKDRILKHKDLLIEDAKAGGEIIKSMLHRMENMAAEVKEQALAKAQGGDDIA